MTQAPSYGSDECSEATLAVDGQLSSSCSGGFLVRVTGDGNSGPLWSAILVPKILGYRQVSDVTLLYLARVGGMKRIAFDRPVATLRSWTDHLELLTP